MLAPSSGPALTRAKATQQQPEPAAEWHLPRGLALNMRERILLGLLVFSVAMVAAIMPRASVDAHQYMASNPDLQPVERPEENFAGSAFYFLAPDDEGPQNYSDSETDGLLMASGQGGSADMIRPIAFNASLTDNSRALQCLTSAIYYEAGVEPDAGQRAVAQVVLNRVRHPSYPATVCGVVFQGSERQTGCQFSYTCDGSLLRAPSKYHWARAQKVAALALAGRIASPVGTATHYHTTEVHPYWADSLRFLGTIGAHRFYSWKGSAGKASAFSQYYHGGEPLPGPKPRKYDLASSPPLDPIALEKAYEEGRRKAVEEARKAEQEIAMAADNARRHGLPVPSTSTLLHSSYDRERLGFGTEQVSQQGPEKTHAGQNLPDNSQIKPEYRNSGTWKAKPAS